MVGEALESEQQAGLSMLEGELYRHKGELMLQAWQLPSTNSPPFHGERPEVEVANCFLKALESARQKQAKSLELRTSMSLARLWQSQGKQRQAHNSLSEIYHWFTEGFNTKDLQEAKALMEELAERSSTSA